MIAGPGSGKTRVVTHRIAYMLLQGVNPHNVLALTFTNKAADEMRLRIERLVSDRGYWMGTFHGFCARLLRQYGNLVGLAENFTILDSKDSKQALKRALDAENIELTHTSIDSIAWEISNAKSNLLTSSEYTTSKSGTYAVVSEVTRRAYPAYDKYLLSSNAVDFDDLLLHVAVLLRDNPELRSRLDDRYRYIMVDEYQDTNLAQYAIVRALSLDHQNLSVTGDPDQSIYAWRGANISNILEFQKDYPAAQVIRLEQNYRSTGHILKAADQLIAHNRNRKPKKLFTDNPRGEPVRLVCFPHPREEAGAIAERISSEVKQGGHAYKDFAIFYRVNAFSRPLEHALHRKGIPYQIVRGLEFYQRKEVKDLIAYLHLVNNPANNVAFHRVVNLPPRGIGKKTLSLVQSHAQRYDVTMLEACREAGLIESLSKRAAAAISRFVTLIDVLITSVHLPLAELITELVTQSGFDKYLEIQDAKTDEDRRANIDELINAAREFEMEMMELDEDGEVNLESFLEHVSLVSDIDGYDADPDKVLMMSLHAAKGLEFPSVFIVGLEHGILPHERSMEDEDSREEERRLLFVGITRAEQQLQLSYNQRRTFRGHTRIAAPSQFLYELPRDEMQCFLPQAGFSTIDETTSGDFEPSAEYFEAAAEAEQDVLTSPENSPAMGTVKSPDLPEELLSRQSVLAAGDLPQLTTAAELLASQNPEQQKTPPEAFTCGMHVSHTSYGSGVILAITGTGDKRTATVEFRDQQQRKFRLAFARLTPMES